MRPQFEVSHAICLRAPSPQCLAGSRHCRSAERFTGQLGLEVSPSDRMREGFGGLYRGCLDNCRAVRPGLTIDQQEEQLVLRDAIRRCNLAYAEIAWLAETWQRVPLGILSGRTDRSKTLKSRRSHSIIEDVLESMWRTKQIIGDRLPK